MLACAVADTGNHKVRALDLTDGTVASVAGTGEQARWGDEGGPARKTALNSLWDLAPWEGRIVIAMAGVHQLWTLDLEMGEVGVLAGSGMEGLGDGPARAAVMAQPSGGELLTKGGLLQSGDELPARTRLDLGDDEGVLDVLLRVGGCE